MSERFKSKSINRLQADVKKLVSKRANAAGDFSCVDDKLFKAMTTEIAYRKRYGDIYKGPAVEVNVTTPVVEVEEFLDTPEKTVEDTIPQETEIELNRVTFFREEKEC